MLESLKRVFGFSAETGFSEIDEFDNETEVADKPASTLADGELPIALLDAILGVINSSLPPIVANAIDPQRQRAELAAMLGPSLATYAEQAKANAVRELTGDRAKMAQELEELRSERKEMASRREEQKANLMSEQRQRRALQDRNRDLEAKVAELDSEIEQHKLTISSLMNKVRVAEVTDGDSAAELESVKSELAGLKQKIESLTAEIAEKDSKIAELTSPEAIETALEQRRAMTGESDSAQPEVMPQKRRRGRPRRVASVAPIQEPSEELADMESVDWLLPGGAPASHTPQVSDPDFGYQPPKQVTAPDNDAQLSLFE